MDSQRLNHSAAGVPGSRTGNRNCQSYLGNPGGSSLGGKFAVSCASSRNETPRVVQAVSTIASHPVVVTRPANQRESAPSTAALQIIGQQHPANTQAHTH